VRPRKGSAAVCSRCHQPAPGYDQLAERRFEFIPLWGADSGRSGALIPIEVGQSFRSKWGADSDRKWGTFWVAP